MKWWWSVKKNGHSKNWKPPHSYQIVPILARKSSFQYRYLEGSKWPVLQNLSLIYIIMKIHEKKFTTLSIGILWTGTLLVVLPCCCTGHIMSSNKQNLINKMEHEMQCDLYTLLGNSFNKILYKYTYNIHEYIYTFKNKIRHHKYQPLSVYHYVDPAWSSWGQH